MANDNPNTKLKPPTAHAHPLQEPEDATVVTSLPDPSSEGIKAEDPYINRIFGQKYHIKEQVGRGGIGLVYRATQQGLNRDVVIKLLKQESQHDHSTTQRFSREAQALSLLNHNHIVGVYDFGQEGDLSYIVMEYIDGVSLDQLIKQMGCIPLSIFAPIARQILDAVGEAHSYGIIHRDLKPSNVMLTARKGYPYYVKVLDFGLVKLLSEESDLTGQHKLVGTIAYLSPEQILGGEADQRVDVYALGVLFYHMLCGQKPFRGRDMTVLYQHIHQEATPLQDLLDPNHDIPPRLIALVHRCLSKEPSQRPADANALLAEFLETLGDASILEFPSGEFSSPSIPNLRAMRHHALGDTSSERSSSDAIPNRTTSGPWQARDISASSPSISRPGLELPSSPSISRDGFSQPSFDAPPAFAAPAEAPKKKLSPAVFALIALAIIAVPVTAFILSKNNAPAQNLQEPPAAQAALTPTSAQAPAQDEAPKVEPDEEIAPNQPEEAAANQEATLRFTGADPEVTILADGKPLSLTNNAATLAPGTYTLSVEQDGYKPWSKTVELKAGQAQAIAVALVKQPEAKPEATTNKKTYTWRPAAKTTKPEPKPEAKPEPKVEDKPATKTDDKPKKDIKLLSPGEKPAKTKGEFELLTVDN